MDIVNYKRTQKLFNLCTKPALLRILDAHLKENKLSFTAFLDRHKHRIFHLYRLKNSCCPNAINCQNPEKLPLVRNQWLILYDNTKNLHCNKSSCVCNVITNHVRAANLDVYILSLLMVTLNVGDTNVMPGIRGVHRECNLCELMRPKRMSDEKFETRWKNMTAYLLKLGVAKDEIYEVRKMKVDTPEYVQPDECVVVRTFTKKYAMRPVNVSQ